MVCRVLHASKIMKLIIPFKTSPLKGRIMHQKWKVQWDHTLQNEKKKIGSYLINKRWDHNLLNWKIIPHRGGKIYMYSRLKFGIHLKSKSLYILYLINDMWNFTCLRIMEISILLIKTNERKCGEIPLCHSLQIKWSVLCMLKL